MLKRKQFTFACSGLASYVCSFLLIFLLIIQLSCDAVTSTNGGEEDPDSTPTTTEVETNLTTTGGDVGGFVQPVISGIVPSEVKFPPNAPSAPVDNRPFFDHFSWQTFIALSWPVKQDQRGVPDNPTDPSTFLNMTNSTPVVWTSYKNQWDLFGQGEQGPTPWDSFDNPNDLCPNQPVNHVFGSAKSDMLPGEGDESFSVPLVDQRQNYALFEIRYNELQYNFIRDNKLYRNKGLQDYKNAHGGVVTMPESTATSEGSILVKAAWKQLTPEDDESRYYVVDEIVFDPVSSTCKKQRVGLIGLHIAQKVDTFPQWVWSSFEQVDNVPGAPNAKQPYSFNNGTDNPATQRGYANKPASKYLIKNKNDRKPVQVTRLNEIPTTPDSLSTVDLNKLYQAAVGNTWMQYYELVITQWPTDPKTFKQYTQNGIYPGDCGQPFPESNCVNTTMETYYQSPQDANAVGGNSCMSCHYTAPDTDFSWSVQLRSY
ncbi:MAG: hypothetical protein R2788_24015 [Saprospiraceae bacterium]